MCVKCILLTLYVNRLSGMCSLRFDAGRKSVGTRHVFFLPDGCDADDCCILFFHNRAFKINRYCKILGCYLYLCRQIAYFFNNASCARQNVSKLPLPSLALPLNNASCARQNVSKLPLPSLALPLNNASCARQTERKLLLRLESRDDDIKRK